MGYASTLTQAGFALQAKLFAEGGDLHITRVAVGSGIPADGADLTEMTALVQERSTATSTTPVRRGCAVDFFIEYRPDLNPEITEAFQITEYGVFGLGAEGEEQLLFYGDVSHFPETAVPAQYGGSVRRYPVHVEIGATAGAVLDYPAGAWCTYEDMAALAGALAIRRVGLVLPTEGWTQDAEGRYGYRIELPVDGVTGETIPSATILPDSEETAMECGLCNAAQTGDGVVIFRAGTIPVREIALSLALLRDSTGLVLSTSAGNVSLPMATQTSPGVVKPGPGLLVDGEGTLSADVVSDAAAKDVLDSVFGVSK